MHNYGLVETPKDSQEYLITSSPIQDEDNGIVGVMFSFERYSYPFVSKYYLPCFGLTILTSISFLIPPKSIPGRAGMLVTLCLVLNNIFISSKVIKLKILSHVPIPSKYYNFRMRHQHQKHQHL